MTEEENAKYTHWKYNSYTDEDGFTYHWAEFHYSDGTYASSPTYDPYCDDFYCLREGVNEALPRFQNGDDWRKIISDCFRQNW